MGNDGPIRPEVTTPRHRSRPTFRGSGEIWAAAAEHFGQEQLSSILLCVALANFSNRINRAMRTPAGKVW
ncbi:hypothetical protein KDL01_40900 [Actinospica durhamensis]|uniref:Carboxymuconolactone decarboxylase family protein n=1 Tax=Actinospica durhamensis TaxID=1508375 RepID=A0A941IUV3_9ACTN|nr:hypothetical protein [Actinospica durhamensis]MBR7839682.1 hypothetical protein [Actinospica durhamensis]